MLQLLKRKLFADPSSTSGMMLRLLTEYGPIYWRSFALSFVMMAMASGSTAGIAYLIGSAVNQALVSASFWGVSMVAVSCIALFAIKGLSTYGQVVTLAKITNNIAANNQQLAFDKLIWKRVGFFSDRHSSEFVLRINYSATAPGAALNMIVTALGRDLLTLIGLIAVMAIQTPILSFFALFVMPPSVWMVRHLVKRVKNITTFEFGGYAKVVEALQETFQGIRFVKALNLENAMRRRVAENIRSIEYAANKLARVSNRSGPLMEALGGVATALVLIYGSYEILYLNAKPGQFVSFITAFLLAYEPAKRIVRLNVSLSGIMVGVSMFLELVDSPEPTDDGVSRGEPETKPRLVIDRARIEFDNVSFWLQAECAGPALALVRRRAGADNRFCRPVRWGQNDHLQSVAPLLRLSARNDCHRRSEYRGRVGRVGPREDRLCRAGCVPVSRINS